MGLTMNNIANVAPLMLCPDWLRAAATPTATPTTTPTATPTGLSLVNLAQSERASLSGPDSRVAVLSVFGPIVPFESEPEQAFFTGLQTFMRGLREAVADPNVSSVAVLFHSPGGSTMGVQEAVAEISRLVKLKPIVAVVNYLCASAAYWLASPMTRIIASPSSLVGSVGVFTEHVDISESLRMAGVKVTGIARPEDKLATTDTEPLSDRGRAELELVVNSYYESFARDVSAFRGLSRDAVWRDFVQVSPAERALSVGMVDEIATLREAVDGLVAAANNRPATARARARVDVLKITSGA